jgi:hypothetical protein
MPAIWPATKNAFMSLSLEGFSLAARRTRLDSKPQLMSYMVAKTFLRKVRVAKDLVLYIVAQLPRRSHYPGAQLLGRISIRQVE